MEQFFPQSLHLDFRLSASRTETASVSFCQLGLGSSWQSQEGNALGTWTFTRQPSLLQQCHLPALLVTPQCSYLNCHTVHLFISRLLPTQICLPRLLQSHLHTALTGPRQSPSYPSRPGLISSGAPTGFPGSLSPALWASPMYTLALILGFIGDCDCLSPDFGGQGPCLISLCPVGSGNTLVSE